MPVSKFLCQMSTGRLLLRLLRSTPSDATIPLSARLFQPASNPQFCVLVPQKGDFHLGIELMTLRRENVGKALAWQYTL